MLYLGRKVPGMPSVMHSGKLPRVTELSELTEVEGISSPEESLPTPKPVS